jgi:hypothetical protein
MLLGCTSLPERGGVNLAEARGSVFAGVRCDCDHGMLKRVLGENGEARRFSEAASTADGASLLASLLLAMLRVCVRSGRLILHISC